MELTGQIIKKMETQTFASGFQKRTVVIKTQEQYPKEIPVEFFKDHTSKLDDVNEGDTVKIGYNLQGGKYTNAKGEDVYTVGLSAWFINKLDETNAHESFGHEKKTRQDKKQKVETNPFEEDETGLPF